MAIHALISSSLLKSFVFIDLLSTFMIIVNIDVCKRIHVYSSNIAIHGSVYVQIVLQIGRQSCILVLVCNNDAQTQEPLT